MDKGGGRLHGRLSRLNAVWLSIEAVQMMHRKHWTGMTGMGRAFLVRLLSGADPPKDMRSPHHLADRECREEVEDA